jgi:cytochrome-b5 reductase
VAGGTGIAPLLQIARIVLNDHQGDDDNVDVTVEVDIDDEVHVHLLFINRFEYDILGKSEIDKMVEKYKGRFHVFYALTGNHSTTDESNGSAEADHAIATATAAAATNSNQYLSGRGDVNMAKIALPPPSPNTMIFVCGKDGFVEHWGGPVVRAPPPPGKKKGPKIQGPLLGILAEAGYTADQVFKY